LTKSYRLDRLARLAQRGICNRPAPILWMTGIAGLENDGQDRGGGDSTAGLDTGTLEFGGQYNDGL